MLNRHSPSAPLADELCEICRRIDFTSPPGESETYSLGRLPYIFKRTECPLCRLITHRFRQDWEKENYDAVGVFSVNADVALGVTYFTPSGNAREGEPSILTFLPVGPSERQNSKDEITWKELGPLIVGHCESSPEAGSYPVKGHVVGEYAKLDMLKRWIHDCDMGHDAAGQPAAPYSARLPAALSVIDVHKRCLTTLPNGARFFALSYVWGKYGFLMAYQTIVAMLSQEGALANNRDVPSVVTAAMDLVEDLDERFLWVDALCIPQDDSPEKAFLISRMDAIYTGAYATIVAIDGLNALEGGLPGIRHFPRARKQVVETVGPFFIATPCKSPEEIKDSSLWNTRGWTYQEQMLSSRSVYLSGDQMFFQCKHGATCTESRTEVSFHRKSLSSQLNEITPQSQNFRGKTNPLLLFGEFLTAYSSRSLSFPGDRLNAFSGVIAYWESFGFTSFLNGLPQLDLSFPGLSLLWEPVTLAERLIVTSVEGIAYAPLPSWSWAGWIGRVKYADHIYLKDIQNFQPKYQNMQLIPGERHDFGPSASVKHNGAGVALTADRLCFRARSASFYVCFEDAVVIQHKFMSEHHVYLCVYDHQGHHCGVAIGLDPDPSVTAATHTRGKLYECVRMFTGGKFDTISESLHLIFKSPRPDLIEVAETDPSIYEDDMERRCGFYDESVFKETPHSLVQVLIIKTHGLLSERVAMGMIHEDAFRNAEPEEKDFIIA